ncbi:MULTISPECIES: flagellar motor protein MotB [unclassified Cryobacterium]|uniref:OmpA/MotB family protein n=1 Tax=unclassified Cryobacterium TaxID=2649013 RepID=UPI002AB49F4A|nr:MULTISPECIES: flagellar motor protein MotB [unclassified Cryobacterium]MDY7543570.1 flagellar motor protein MotB [Cryobacterium sp. 5B3]MEA9999155.1 flagellar motor protein MotB [Cryobacterium sp. RTS3]MEB0266196.1 flagellar motor protein MotB [Cryobacterium sp. 10I5]MEB0273072.1 flagellar motor protein MotB [Cryobacterium sp. 5B3]
MSAGGGHGGGRGRGRGRGLEEEHVEHVDERWMASYMDMVTVLMCMFIVLFAMSSVDSQKFFQLKNSLATGFGAVDVGKIDTATGVVVSAANANANDPAAKDLGTAGATSTSTATATATATPAATPGPALTDLQIATQEVADLSSVQAALKAAVTAQGIDSIVQFTIDARGLTIGLVGTDAFFAPNLATLSPKATAVIDAMSPILAADKREVTVEGHADRHGVTVNYATDWELSSARATSVLRRFVEVGGVAGERISAIGYGSTRSVTTADSLDAMAQNRRVDVVLLSSEPDAVRALIPSILAGQAAGP